MQALGPGYHGRVPATPSYRSELIGRTTILEHRDLHAWFDELFVTLPLDRRHVEKVPVPPVLADARAELAAILSTYGPAG